MKKRMLFLLIISPLCNAMSKDLKDSTIIDIKDESSDIHTAATDLLSHVKFLSSKGYTADDVAGALARYSAQKDSKAGAMTTVKETVNLFKNKTIENKVERKTVLTELIDHVVDNAEIKTAQQEALKDVATGNLQKSKIGIYVAAGLGIAGTVLSAVLSHYFPTVVQTAASCSC